MPFVVRAFNFDDHFLSVVHITSKQVGNGKAQLVSCPQKDRTPLLQHQ